MKKKIIHYIFYSVLSAFLILTCSFYSVTSHAAEPTGQTIEGEEPGDSEDPFPDRKPEQTIDASDVVVSFGDGDFQLDVTLEEGNGNLSYSSSQPDIAEIDDDAWVTVHKPGTTEITITASETEKYQETEKIITLTISSMLSEPSLTSAVNTNEGIQLTWDEVANAEGYFLSRKTSTETWQIIATLTDTNTLSYLDTQVVAGTSYSYRLQAYYASGDDLSSFSSSKSCRRLVQPTLNASTSPDGNGNLLSWTKSTGASGYYIYRKTSEDSSWEKICQVVGGTALTWKDTDISNGQIYYYAITAYYKTYESILSPTYMTLYLKCPTIRLTRKSASKIQVTWSKNSSVSGYQLQYSRDNLFINRKTKNILSPDTESLTLSGLTKNKTYYFRIRSYVTVNGKKYYSAWKPTSNVKTTKTASVSILKKGTKTFELRAQSKLPLYQYDTLQGGCSDGTYGYFIMYNRSVEKCRIVKVRLSTRKVTKISAILEVAHGNDMTYNTKKKCLAVIHHTKNGKRISLVNPSTLTVTEVKDVKIPSVLAGATDAQRKAIGSFASIAYNESKNQYVVLLSTSHNFLILDENLEAVCYLNASRKNNTTYQGIDATDDYILVSQSAKYSGQQNIISIYTWEGTYVSQINVKKGYEIENIFHTGKQFYAGFYRSYYKTYYTKEKQKVKKKVNGKIKTVTKTVKIKHRKLMRDNYIYSLTNL